MPKTCNLKFDDSQEIFKFDKVAKQTNGSVLFSLKNCVMLGAVVSELDNSQNERWTPLTVQYIEKTYANAKINGGYLKREGKPSDFETLTSRVIDRSLRPLFPDGYSHPTTITVMVLSVDDEVDLQTMAVNCASASLFQSDIPINKAVCAIRVGKINDKLVLNPTNSQLKTSTIDLFLSGVDDELLMIEMMSNSSVDFIEADIENFVKIHNTNEIDDDSLIEVIKFGIDGIETKSKIYKDAWQTVAKDVREVKLIEEKLDKDLLIYIKEKYHDKIKEAVSYLSKNERSNKLNHIIDEVLTDDKIQQDAIEVEMIRSMVIHIKRDIVRDMIINENIRADGRGLTDIRPISIETNILPSVHGSCLFTRGQTQSLSTITLGENKDGQMYEMLANKTTKIENFMLHYNFAGFCVGEAKPIMGVSRRELGHGNLAKKALYPTLDKEHNGTIRLVSEILESNGSSSMATVCASSICLKLAGMPISSLVAGVAMGAVVQDDQVKILTDITGLEDHDGDIDFKIAGTKDGITAMQMDIKLGGIKIEHLKTAIYQASKAKLTILDIMEKSTKDIVPSEALPLFEQFKIDPSKIMVVIGKAGATIKKIIEEFDISIDIDRESGLVKLKGDDQNKLDKAKDHIVSISNNSDRRPNINFETTYNIGEVYSGKVERVVDFGAFISLPKGGEGLLHISKIASHRINNIHDAIKVGDIVDVLPIKTSKDRIELSKKGI